MMISLLFNECPDRILLVGLGAGSLLHFLSHHFPHCRIEAIDNSAGVIDLAREYFQLPDRPEISIHHRDGYRYLADRGGDEAGYDIILIDAFDTRGMARSIYRADFLDLCRTHLQNNGTICMNLWSGDKNRLTEVKEDVAGAFQDVAVVPVPKRGNMICIGRKNQSIWQVMQAKSGQASQLQARYDIDFRTIINCCIRKNFTLRQRLSYYFSRPGNHQA